MALLVPAAIAATVGLAFSACGAAACDGPFVPFYPPVASEIAAGVVVTNGGMMLHPKADDAYYFQYADWPSDDIELCAVVTDIAGAGADGGLIFWGASIDDKYVFSVAPDGTAYVSHYHDARWDDAINQPSPAIKRGVGAANELRVVTTGQTAKVFINGQPFGTVTRDDSTTRHIVGIIANSSDTEPSVFAFDDITGRAP